MKKSRFGIFAIILMLSLCIACLVGCGHTHEYERVIDGSTFTMTCSCGDTLQEGYRIQFVYAEDGSKADEGIVVRWVDASNNKHVATTNSLGYVEATGLELDSYTLEIDEDTLPTINGLKYFYNATAFTSQQKGVGLIIPLSAGNQPLNANDENITGRLVDANGNDDYSNLYQIELNKTYVATLTSAEDKIWYSVINDGFGKYTIDATAASGVEISLERRFANSGYVNPSPDSNVDASVQNKLTYTVVYQDRDLTSTLTIQASNATSYPVSIPFSVSITTQIDESLNVGKYTMIVPEFFETKDNTYIYYTEERGSGLLIENEYASLLPVDGVAKCQNVEGGTINSISADQVENLQLLQDGYYYTADNKLVYAKIDASSIFSSTTLARYLADSASAGTTNFAIYNMAEKNEEYGYYTRRDNYFGFVQAYAALTNSDGLYPLTHEMYQYLKEVAEKEKQDVASLLCVYSTQTNSFASGDGTESNPYAVELSNQTLGNYSLSIAQDGKVYVTLSGNMEITLTFNSSVKATINQASYQEPLTVNGSVTVVFETTDGSALDFVLKIEKYDNPYYLEVGTNDVSIIANAKCGFEFIAQDSGEYTVSVSSATVSASAYKQGETPTVLNGTHTVTLESGESLFFTIESETSVEVSIYITLENE